MKDRVNLDEFHVPEGRELVLVDDKFDYGNTVRFTCAMECVLHEYYCGGEDHIGCLDGKHYELRDKVEEVIND